MFGHGTDDYQCHPNPENKVIDIVTYTAVLKGSNIKI